MKIDLSGKTALVTGSTAGIGNAIAKGLAGTGAEVVINGRGQAKVDAAIAAIAKAVPGAKIRGIAADVSTSAGCKALYSATCMERPAGARAFSVDFTHGSGAVMYTACKARRMTAGLDEVRDTRG